KQDARVLGEGTVMPSNLRMLLQKLLHHFIEKLRLDSPEGWIPPLPDILEPFGKQDPGLILLRPYLLPDALAASAGRVVVIDIPTLAALVEAHSRYFPRRLS